MAVAAKSYIQNNEGPYFFAWAIAQHESRQTHGATDYVYNEFNAGPPPSASIPNFSGGFPAQDGWGIFQRDDTGNGIYVDTDQIYSWTVNTTVAFNELSAKQSLAQQYFAAIQRVNPTTYEPPPHNQKIWGAPGDPATNTLLTALQAATITLYNGASVRVPIPDVITDPHDPPSSTIYASCWMFNPNAASGHRWTFVPNQNDYVYKVITEYEIKNAPPFHE